MTRAKREATGSFASRDFDICLRNLLQELCGESRRFAETVICTVKWPSRIAEICGDDESARKMHRKMSESRLEKFPT